MSDRQPNTTIRVNHQNGYFVASKTAAMDKTLTCKAKGLLYTLLSTPEGWHSSVAGLVAICADGRAAVMSGLQELEAHGYLVRRRLQDDKGCMVGMEYVLYETPQTPPADAPEEPLAENRTMDTLEQPDPPQSDFPTADNPTAENRQQLINNKIDNPPTPQGGAAEEPPKRRKVDYTPEFEQFWAAYPSCDHKRDKGGALKAWRKQQKLKPAALEDVIRGLEWDKQSYDWHKDNGRYIPWPSTWLNRRGWEDARPPAAPVPASAAEAEADEYARPENWL